MGDIVDAALIASDVCCQSLTARLNSTLLSAMKDPAEQAPSSPGALLPSIPRWCLSSHICNLMHSIAMEQVAGARKIGDWEAVKQVG